MARPKILVFQHVPYEPLGTLDPLLREAGFRIRYVNFGRNPVQEIGWFDVELTAEGSADPVLSTFTVALAFAPLYGRFLH